MNWKLIFQLSLLALAMGVLTVFVIPSTIEPFFWLVILLVSAYFIATRAPDRYFLHGLLLGIVNSIWVTGAHVLLFAQYVARHPREAGMMQSMPLPTHPRVMQIIVGACVGVISGIIIGLFSWVAHRLLTPRARATVTSS